MATALIGLGSNLDNRAGLLTAAVTRLAATPEIRLATVSRQFPSLPVGGPSGQREYLNAAARLETTLSPEQLLDQLQQIENDLGRRRDVRWGPRTIDLDLLLYDDAVSRTPRLLLPHPRLAVRRFVLEPAAEIAPDMVHPTFGWTIERLLEHLCNHPRYVALAGPIGVGKTQSGRQIAATVRERLSLPATTVEEPIDDAMLARFYANPAGLARQTELEFLRQRTVLMADLSARTEREWVVSDFWFAQALAYAHLWLDPEERRNFGEAYKAAVAQVLTPKLLVVLDATPDELRRRIAERGRPYETRLEAPLLERLRQSIAQLSSQPGLGPVLHLSGMAAEEAVDEVVAAVAGMQ